MIHLELTEREARTLLRGAEFYEQIIEGIFDHACEATQIRRLAITKLTSALERGEVAA